MKYFVLGTMLMCTISNIRSQTNIKNANIIFSTELINLAISPDKSIIKAFFSVKKFVNGKQGIEFSFLLKPHKDIPKVNLDSIIIISSDYKILSIHNPYFDTTYALMDLNLSYNSLHWLRDVDIKFFKEELISEFILLVDNSTVTIKLNKKSQKELNTIAKATL